VCQTLSSFILFSPPCSAKRPADHHRPGGAEGRWRSEPSPLPPAAGLRNRKFFILFLAYSALLCAAGAALTWHEVRHSSTARGRALLATLAQPGGLDLLLDQAPDDETRSRIRVAAFFGMPGGGADFGGAAGKRLGGGHGRAGAGRRGGASVSHSSLALPSLGSPWLLSAILHESRAER
jgi:hypothetical protein